VLVDGDNVVYGFENTVVHVVACYVYYLCVVLYRCMCCVVHVHLLCCVVYVYVLWYSVYMCICCVMYWVGRYGIACALVLGDVG